MPPEALARGISGVVVADVEFLDGVLQQVTIASGPEVYHQAVKDALAQYQCRGSPGKMRARQSFTFAVDGAPPNAQAPAPAPAPAQTQAQPPAQAQPLAPQLEYKPAIPTIYQQQPTPWVKASTVNGLNCPVKPLPQYPPVALRDGLSGVVVVQGTIEESNISTYIVSGPDVFHKAVRDAVSSYKCPALQSSEMIGQRKKVTTTWRFEQAFEFKAGPNDFVRMLCPDQVAPNVPANLPAEDYAVEVKTQILVVQGKVQGINFLSGSPEFNASITAAMKQYSCRSSDKPVTAFQTFRFKRPG